MSDIRDAETDATDEIEAQWQDLTEKEILIGILTECQQIRMAVTQADSGASDGGKDEPAYRCQRCDETVPEDSRERHARKTHKAPGDMIEGMFERAD